MKIHASITGDRIADAIQDQCDMTLHNAGFCVACGKDANGCDPDARGYYCKECGAPCVYAVNELLMCG